MCLLSYKKPRGKLTRSDLEGGASANPHGCGWAFVYDGNLIVKHYLDAVLAIDEFMAMQAAFPDAEAMFHSRYASVTMTGSLDACHPVWVGNDKKRVVGHNGFLFPVPDGRTDTQVFAEDVLPHWDLSDPARRAELELHMGDSKAVVLSADEPAVILNAHLGVRRPNGVWHSNPTFNGVPLVPSGKCALCRCKSAVRVCGDCQRLAEPRRVFLAGA
jgi:hypothetical protein